MNKLTELIKNDNFPVLFRYNDLNNTGLKSNELQTMFDEALKNGWIESIYKNIYKLKDLSFNHEKYVSQNLLSQMIRPDSYVSCATVLYDENWIIDGIVNTTCVTTGKDEDIYIKEYGGFFYKNLYKREIEAGTYWENESNGRYRRAKPLRALCDLIYGRSDKIYSMENLNTVLRMPEHVFYEDMKKEDFDELQYKFEIREIEIFLLQLRREIGI